MNIDDQNVAFTDDEYLTRNQVCDLLKISTKTLWDWKKAGVAPPTVKVGGTLRYPKSMLDKFLREHVQVNNPEE